MKKILVVLMFICFNVSAKDNVMELPFHLKFGMTLIDLDKLGMQVKLKEIDGNIETYNLQNNFKGWANKSLIFFQKRLNGIELLSGIYDDTDGKEVINEYKKYHSILSNECHEVDPEMINGINAIEYIIPNDEFYLKNSYKNYKGLSSTFKNCPNNTEYQLGIFRTNNGGHIYLAYYSAKAYVSR